MKRLIILLALLLAGCQNGGHSISGTDLGKEVGTMEGNTDPSTMVCEDVPKIEAGAISDCHDGSALTYRVTFDDSQGHFHVDVS